VVPAQKSRDLLNREAAHQHVAQLGHSASDHYLSAFAAGCSSSTATIEAPMTREQSFQFGMRWPVQEGADFDVRHSTV
jgi:hypothetical protein